MQTYSSVGQAGVEACIVRDFLGTAPLLAQFRDAVGDCFDVGLEQMRHDIYKFGKFWVVNRSIIAAWFAGVIRDRSQRDTISLKSLAGSTP